MDLYPDRLRINTHTSTPAEWNKWKVEFALYAGMV